MIKDVTENYFIDKGVMFSFIPLRLSTILKEITLSGIITNKKLPCQANIKGGQLFTKYEISFPISRMISLIQEHFFSSKVF